MSALNHDLSSTARHLKAGFALHYGEVSYGNIGGGDRLDFTGIGPDVNLTSRIERLCREVGRNLIMSEDLVRYLDSPVFEISYFSPASITPACQRVLNCIETPISVEEKLACSAVNRRSVRSATRSGHDEAAGAYRLNPVIGQSEKELHP